MLYIYILYFLAFSYHGEVVEGTGNWALEEKSSLGSSFVPTFISDDTEWENFQPLAPTPLKLLPHDTQEKRR